MLELSWRGCLVCVRPQLWSPAWNEKETHQKNEKRKKKHKKEKNEFTLVSVASQLNMKKRLFFWGNSDSLLLHVWLGCLSILRLSHIWIDISIQAAGQLTPEIPQYFSVRISHVSGFLDLLLSDRDVAFITQRCLPSPCLAVPAASVSLCYGMHLSPEAVIFQLLSG